jgi:polysaccharide export outer membrane protein
MQLYGRALVKILSLGFYCAIASSALGQDNSAGYGIQPGDVLEIMVWREPDLQREILVRSDGGITFPLAGDISARGWTTSRLTEVLTKKLSEYIPDPVVTVSVKEMAGNKIYVIGKVNQPGEFTLLRPTTVLQALSMAGGVTPYADEDNIKVVRGEGLPDQKTFQFDYSDVKRGKGLEQNVILEPGDVVVVP